MIAIKIKENSKQAKLFVEYAKSFSFVEIQDANSVSQKDLKQNLKALLLFLLKNRRKEKQTFIKTAVIYLIKF